jgi:hypothetical protein
MAESQKPINQTVARRRYAAAPQSLRNVTADLHVAAIKRGLSRCNSEAIWGYTGQVSDIADLALMTLCGLHGCPDGSKGDDDRALARCDRQTGYA